MAFFTTFWLFLYKTQSKLPETRKIWECFAEETQQVQRRCIAKLRADVKFENRWLLSCIFALICHTNYSMAFFTTFWSFLYKNQGNLPETRKIWEFFAKETQQVQRRCIVKLRADVKFENMWLI